MPSSGCYRGMRPTSRALTSTSEAADFMSVHQSDELLSVELMARGAERSMAPDCGLLGSRVRCVSRSDRPVSFHSYYHPNSAAQVLIAGGGVLAGERGRGSRQG